MPNYFWSILPIFKIKRNFFTTVDVLFWRQKKSDNLRLSGYREAEGEGRVSEYLKPGLIVVITLLLAVTNLIFPFFISAVIIGLGFIIAYSLFKLSE